MGVLNVAINVAAGAAVVLPALAIKGAMTLLQRMHGSVGFGARSTPHAPSRLL